MVVGAGVVGLSVAWFLQEHGYEVRVLDRVGAGAGASSGNAGWISPSIVTPLPEPSVLAYGLRSLFKRDAPLRIPAMSGLRAWRFLLAFAFHCRSSTWSEGVKRLAEIGSIAIQSCEDLAVGGVKEPFHKSPLVLAFESREEAADVRREYELLDRAGVSVSTRELDSEELWAAQPILSQRAKYGIRVDGQGYVRPAQYIASLAESVAARGGSVSRDEVVRIDCDERGSGVVVVTRSSVERADVAVIASGAWLNSLARPAGVRVIVASGRGYSFTVQTDSRPSMPLYLPHVRVACTPDNNVTVSRMRVAGTMEFRKPEFPLDERRIDGIVQSCRPYMEGIEWSSREGAWVGARPVTADGLPIIGATRLPNIYVAGGHGMWGMTLGPVTGRLLAEQIATGREPSVLRPFDPLR